MTRSNISVESLNKMVDYDRNTGLMTWKVAPPDIFEAKGNKTKLGMCITWNKITNGGPAFNRDSGNGYLMGTLLGKNYKAHRVAYAIHTGDWPEGEVDHIDGDRRNNKPENLRDVSKSVNQRNCAVSANNTSGVTGVSYSSRDKMWLSQITRPDGTLSVCRFIEKKDAINAQMKERTKFGYHKNHGRIIS